jgi:glycosyltransferase involved in cell wall biosynthesis
MLGKTIMVSFTTLRRDNARLRLCFVSSFPPNRGYLAEYAYYLVKHLSEKEDIEIIVLADKFQQSERIEEGKVKYLEKVTCVRCWERNKSISLFNIIANLWKFKPDIVHFNCGIMSWGKSRIVNFVGILIPLITKLLGYHILVTLHNIGETIDPQKLEMFKLKRLNRFGLWLAIKFLSQVNIAVPLRRYAKILKQKYKAKSVQYIPHGTLGALVNQVTTGGKTVLTFGFFSEHKNLPLLIQAVREIHENDGDVKLVIAGSSHPNRPGYLENIKKTYGHESFILFTGYVPEQKLKELFEKSTVVVLPYLFSVGSSGVFHLACSFGKPIIISDLPDYKDMLEAEGGAAILIPPEDRQTLIESIRRMIHDQQLQKELGERSLKMAESLNFNHVSQKYVNLYRKIITSQ